MAYYQSRPARESWLWILKDITTLGRCTWLYQTSL